MGFTKLYKPRAYKRYFPAFFIVIDKFRRNNVTAHDFAASILWLQFATPK